MLITQIRVTYFLIVYVIMPSLFLQYCTFCLFPILNEVLFVIPWYWLHWLCHCIYQCFLFTGTVLKKCLHCWVYPLVSWTGLTSFFLLRMFLLGFYIRVKCELDNFLPKIQYSWSEGFYVIPSLTYQHTQLCFFAFSQLVSLSWKGDFQGRP